jgi:hypothetical protein
MTLPQFYIYRYKAGIFLAAAYGAVGGPDGEAEAGGAPAGSEEADLEVAADADQIANGHAYEKHAGEFGNPSRGQFKNMIEDTRKHPTETRQLAQGRVAYYSQNTRMLVIADPASADGGTAFKAVPSRINEIR